MINQTYAVFGLGRYGSAVAKELILSGAEVIAVDNDPNTVEDCATFLPVCKCADVTDYKVIEQLGIGNVDVVVVAMADSMEASVLAITHCKEAGVKTVIAKCGNEIHQKIFSSVGADKVVFPEKESGTRLAKNILSAGFMDIIELSKDVSMVEIDVKPEWIGKDLIELKLRRKYSINIVAIIKKEEVVTTINPEAPLEADMKLVVIANKEKLDKIR